MTIAIWAPLSDPQSFASYVPGTVDEIHSATKKSAAPSAEQQAPISQLARIPFCGEFVPPVEAAVGGAVAAACRVPHLAQNAAFPTWWPH